ncbi:MAG: methyltransferase [Gemmatimonadetes bacterium]|uniref:Methyltransferase n=1 Tax=Candidatus Kutchimonas denitrificans TaxID=3056748 RepID=A0AAE5CD81_9BACT|nr:methyltransferase [Gemmatimonadota bacterium]NIR75254.1 methyltransferase [Candidatus Kutchimonas denitrificans]NIS00192.1 methyltransferase [Gemmatimonadota bacterium]NIT65784.1 methyltransferase [Gemmatimonadota bacterium]NIU53062.1 methyltransferase [Gemmatimonadota bacterium]
MRDAVKPQVASDPIGEETLQIMRHASRYNRWIAELIQPYLGDRVLEVGAGIANMTPFLLPREYVVVTDPDPAYLAVLKQRMGDEPTVVVRSLKLPSISEDWKAERLDTAVLLNILEHVEEDVESLVSLTDILMPGGRIVVFVPAVPALHGSLDRALSHHRRYSKEELWVKLESAGLEVEELRYCNFVGMFGWWFYSRVIRRQVLPALQVRLFDLMVPLLSRLERLVHPPIGQSLLAVARKSPR